MVAEFVQIVGLLSAFSSGRKVDELISTTEFLKWLAERNHEEIKNSIEQNSLTIRGIEALLNGGVDTINKRLDDISVQMSILTSRSEGVEELSLSFARKCISSQALEIITLMDETETEFFLLSSQTGVEKQTLILSPSHRNYVCKESHLLKDDLDMLVSLKLLLQDCNSSGEPMYYFTRAASKLVGKR